MTVTLYRMYDAEGALLYVGTSLRWVDRFRAHRQQKDWWANVADIRLEHFASDEDAKTAEIDAIKSESPLLNRGAYPRSPRTRRDRSESGVLTAHEAAAALGVTFHTVRRWITAGHLHASPHTRGDAWEISQTDLDAFVASRLNRVEASA